MRLLSASLLVTLAAAAHGYGGGAIAKATSSASANSGSFALPSDFQNQGPANAGTYSSSGSFSKSSSSSFASSSASSGSFSYSGNRNVNGAGGANDVLSANHIPGSFESTSGSFAGANAAANAGSTTGSGGSLGSASNNGKDSGVTGIDCGSSPCNSQPSPPQICAFGACDGDESTKGPNGYNFSPSSVVKPAEPSSFPKYSSPKEYGSSVDSKPGADLSKINVNSFQAPSSYQPASIPTSYESIPSSTGKTQSCGSGPCGLSGTGAGGTANAGALAAANAAAGAFDTQGYYGKPGSEIDKGKTPIKNPSTLHTSYSSPSHVIVGNQPQYQGGFGGAPGILSPFDRPTPSVGGSPSYYHQATQPNGPRLSGHYTPLQPASPGLVAVPLQPIGIIPVSQLPSSSLPVSSASIPSHPTYQGNGFSSQGVSGSTGLYTGGFGGAPGIIDATGPSVATLVPSSGSGQGKLPANYPTHPGQRPNSGSIFAGAASQASASSGLYTGGFGGAPGIISATGPLASPIHGKTEYGKYNGDYGSVQFGASPKQPGLGKGTSGCNSGCGGSDVISAGANGFGGSSGYSSSGSNTGSTGSDGYGNTGSSAAGSGNGGYGTNGGGVGIDGSGNYGFGNSGSDGHSVSGGTGGFGNSGYNGGAGSSAGGLAKSGNNGGAGSNAGGIGNGGYNGGAGSSGNGGYDASSGGAGGSGYGAGGSGFGAKNAGTGGSGSGSYNINAGSTGGGGSGSYGSNIGGLEGIGSSASNALASANAAADASAGAGYGGAGGVKGGVKGGYFGGGLSLAGASAKSSSSSSSGAFGGGPFSSAQASASASAKAGYGGY